MSTPVNMEAIGAMGQQFNTNFFKNQTTRFNNITRKSAASDIRAHVAGQREDAKATADAQRAAAQADRQKAAATKKAAAAQTRTAKTNAKTQAAGVKSGRVAPGAGAPPRTFAMAPSAEQKQQTAQAATMQQQQFKAQKQQVNFSHGEALKENAARAKTMQSQVNFAHGEAIREAAQRLKGTGNVPVTTNPSKQPLSSGPGKATPPPVPMTPAGKAAPLKSTPVGPQFANTASKSNAPFPTHQHPEGSSNLILPNLTAAQPKPNQFTVGSRNIKGGGIAAMGSKLEEGLATKKFPLPEPRKRV